MTLRPFNKDFYGGNTQRLQSSAFVTARHFHPSLIFPGKAEVSLKPFTRIHTKG